MVVTAGRTGAIGTYSAPLESQLERTGVCEPIRWRERPTTSITTVRCIFEGMGGEGSCWRVVVAVGMLGWDGEWMGRRRGRGVDGRKVRKGMMI